MIRNFIRSCVPPGHLKQAYVPDVYGKEPRKREPSREGKLGVEGMRPAVLLESLVRAGATFLDEEGIACNGRRITKADLYSLGLSGGKNSSAARVCLLKKLDLPERLTADALLDVLNALMTRDEFMSFIADLPDRGE